MPVTGSVMLILMQRETEETWEIVADAVVGRHPGCELHLAHPRVSSRHALVETRGGAWVVRDMGSRNGTSVNGRRLRDWQTLGVGDVVRFAGVALEVIEVSEPDRGGVSATAQERREGPLPYALRLTWTGPAEGVVEVRHAGQVWRREAGMPFVLLALLAEAGDGLDDAALKSLLWGRQGRTMSRSALHGLIYNTRRMFTGWGLDGGCVVKQQGRVWLAVQEAEVLGPA